jgi:hypothetical protein
MVVGLGTAAGWYLFAPKRDDSKGMATNAAKRPSAPVFAPYAGYGNGGFSLSGTF